ncbi:MAG TPA: TonB-dependent receptor [Mucilaginibacter sp.]|jgi:TonB-linked SusC/RagA family outer membrane protein
MKKDVLFKKLNSLKKSIMIFLLTICTCYASFAQNRQITGKVTSSDNGSPLPGVSVKIKGTTAGAITDVSGAFKLSVPADATIVFSYIGFVTQEISTGTTTVFNVKLSPDVNTLSEVAVVSIGYGTAKRTDLTGSISSVGAATIASTPIISLDQALQGRAAGVQVTNNDASPGGNINVLIRGTGSLASNGNGPLYVVDGFPLDAGGINNINPNDISSIDVLKDASATAIYGIRAANGVVLVTTKKGRKDGGVVISVDAYNAFQSKPKEYSVLNAQQFATLTNQMAAVPGTTFVSFAGYANPSALHNIDWQNEVYGTGLTQSYSLAFRGGNDKLQAAASLAYFDQSGIVLDSYFKRATMGVNLDYAPNKWLKSSTAVKYTYQQSNNGFGGQLQNGGGLIQLGELPPSLDYGNKLTNQVKDGNGNYGYFNPVYTQILSYSNPVYSIENNHSYPMNNFILANSFLEFTLLPGLKFKTSGGVNANFFSSIYDQPQDLRASIQYPNQGRIQPGFYSQNINQTFDWLWENTLSYDKTFGKHTINFVGGASAQKTIWNGMGGSGIPPNGIIQDLSQVSQLQLNANNPVGSNTGNGQNIITLSSLFGRLSYNYANKYFITGTIRRDGSSKFPTENQYGTFPSGAIAWKAKEESFLKDVSWLNSLKIRASYGETGNQGPINPYQYQALFVGNRPASFNPGGIGTNVDNLGYPFNKLYQNGIAATQPENDKLKWETDTQADVGLDASFLNGDLTFTTDYYDRKSKDFLLNLAAPPQSGYTSLTKNVGSMENKGLEFAVNYNHVSNHDFRYGLGLNISTVSNKLTSITSGTTFVTNFGGLNVPADGWGTFSETNIGQPVGEFYGYKSLGIFQTQSQIDALNNNAKAKGFAAYQQTGTQPGDRYFADVNGDGTVNATDQVSLGSPIPKFFGGFTMDATYKAWDFNAFFSGVYGNKIFNFQASALESFQNRSFVGIENISENYYQNAWTPSNHSNTYARITTNDDVIGSNVASSAYIQNGSYLKLKNLSVGYTLPTDLMRKISLTKVRVYVSTQNLFTITSYKGLDPEIGVQGGNATQNGLDTGIYPSSRYYTIGLNVTL